MSFRVIADHLATVTLKAVFSVLTVGLALTGSGCGGDSGDSPPVLPSPTVVNEPPPPPPTPGVWPNPLLAGDLWRLTTTIVSLEGSVCFWSHPVGKKFDWTLSVERNGAEVRFVYDVNNPHDNLLFVGAVQEQSFTAASGAFSSFWQCSGGVTLSSSVVGSFSSDGHTLSGRERLIYRAAGVGSELIITYEWNAMRIREAAGREGMVTIIGAGSRGSTSNQMAARHAAKTGNERFAHED